MSWIDDLVGLGGEVVDMVGEVGSQYVDSYVTSQTANRQEINSQPETAQQREPTKGTNADGSPIVQTGDYPAQPAQPSIIAGVSNQNLMLGGLALLLVFVLARKG
ncbi:hypothetical protein [Shewanella psychrotolerans]|uniref:hypothetical protein n=1 Tax=Shewanella psychrotolerans TaxID=2864206 RepID=UPI001C65DEC7|nr:hypothetical protein [Shewanella psychrotolerans]QYK03131.1 hypothetical protein K0I62_09525 [Shewanella psychrotolerans]